MEGKFKLAIAGAVAGLGVLVPVSLGGDAAPAPKPPIIRPVRIGEAGKLDPKIDVVCRVPLRSSCVQPSP